VRHNPQHDKLVAEILEEIRKLYEPIDVKDKAAMLQDVENRIALSDDAQE
jgi:hypothetical protein